MLLVVEDLTPEQRLEAEALERLTQVVSFGPAVIHACRASGDCGATYISPNILEQFGYEPAEFAEQSSSRLDEDIDRWFSVRLQR